MSRIAIERKQKEIFCRFYFSFISTRTRSYLIRVYMYMHSCGNLLVDALCAMPGVDSRTRVSVTHVLSVLNSHPPSELATIKMGHVLVGS